MPIDKHGGGMSNDFLFGLAIGILIGTLTLVIVKLLKGKPGP